MNAQLHLYYGSTETEHGYWADAAANIIKRQEEFNSKNQKAQGIVASFDSLGNMAEKKQAVYEWLQTNIKNISYLEDDEAYERNNTVDEVLERGYGTHQDINYAFLPMKRTPWIDEGMLAFVIADRRLYYPTVPSSSAYSNQSCRCLSLNFTEDNRIKLTVTEKHSGHYARDLRLLWALADSAEQKQTLIERLQENFPEYNLDSLTTTGIDGKGEFLTLSYQLEASKDVQWMGDRILLNPSDYLSKVDYTFEAENREHDIVFDYPYETIDTFKISLPPNWIVEGTPNDTSLYKPCAQLEVMVKREDQQISVCRRFRLKESFSPASDYLMVKSFFGSLKSIESGMLIALRQDGKEM